LVFKNSETKIQQYNLVSSGKSKKIRQSPERAQYHSDGCSPSKQKRQSSSQDLKGRNTLAMGVAHRNKTPTKTKALKGRNTIAMGAAHRNKTPTKPKALKGRNNHIVTISPLQGLWKKPAT